MMIRLSILGIILLSIIGCQKDKANPVVTPIPIKDTTLEDTSSITNPITEDSSNVVVAKQVKIWDLRAEMTRADFEKNKSAELEMMLIRPIYSKVYDNPDGNDSLVVSQLTDGQKALYFFRKMDDAISEGGVEALYQSPIIEHLPEAAKIFKKIGIEKLSVMAEKAALSHQQLNSISSPDSNRKTDPFMKGFDKEYSKEQNNFYKTLETYIRSSPEDFVKFKEK